MIATFFDYSVELSKVSQLSEVVSIMAQECPEFTDACLLDHETLRPSVIAVVDGVTINHTEDSYLSDASSVEFLLQLSGG
ncbi:MoaD/ThiS family protein [Actinomyces trachealis]|uniref:MoaD/ThiS family protein n=1 Tax=Actinomyces trachealis TaxID=2763540 RepID=UPI001892AF2A|nr:MoaD/ThiS family protein [Actinomyces trachealis]